jgi:probable F420-dependent oxidoreductase
MEELVAAGEAADSIGLECVWTPEMYRSAFIPAAALAVATERIGVGTAVALAFVRSELVTALTALDLDDLSGGRFRLGLGTGVKRLNEQWHGATFGRPAPHLRESVALIRRFIATAHRGDPIESVGDYHSIHVRGYQRPFAPVRAAIPIYLAAVGTVMVRLAGEIADGWIAHELESPHHLERKVLPALAAGLARAGRERRDLAVTASACCMPYDDARQAKRWAAGLVAFYASVRTYTDFFDYHGFGREAAAIQERFRADDHSGMVAACPDEMVETFTCSGTPDDVRVRLRAYEGLADTVKLTPPTHLVPPEVTRLAQERILELLA